MAGSTETFIRNLVRSLYHATEGKALWWSLPHKMNGAIRDGIQRATDRGWMLQDRSSVCLTDAGRELVESWWTQPHSRKSPEAGTGSMPSP
jgi:hypothetical protein